MVEQAQNTLPPTGFSGEGIAPPPLHGAAWGIISLTIGILILCTGWLIPLCGVPAGLIGLTLGIVGLKSSVRSWSIAGIVVNSVGLVFMVLSVVFGFLLFFLAAIAEGGASNL